MHATYQMHLRLRDLSALSNSPKYQSIAFGTLSKLFSSFSGYTKDKFLRSYTIVCTIL